MRTALIVICSLALAFSCKKAPKEASPPSEAASPSGKIAPPMGSMTAAKTPAMARPPRPVPPTSGKPGKGVDRLREALKGVLGEAPAVFLAARELSWVSALMTYGRDWGPRELARDLTIALSNIKGVEHAVLAFPVLPGKSIPTSALIILKGALGDNPVFKTPPFPPSTYVTKTRDLVVVAYGGWAASVQKSASKLIKGDLSAILAPGEAVFHMTGTGGETPFTSLSADLRVGTTLTGAVTIAFGDKRILAEARRLATDIMTRVKGGMPRLGRLLSRVTLSTTAEGLAGAVDLRAADLLELKGLVDTVGAFLCAVPESPVDSCRSRTLPPTRGKADLAALTAALAAFDKRFTADFSFSPRDLLMVDISGLAKDPLLRRLRTLPLRKRDERCARALLTHEGRGLMVADRLENPNAAYAAITTSNLKGFEKFCVMGKKKLPPPKQVGTELAIYQELPVFKLFRAGKTWVLAGGTHAPRVTPGKGAAGLGTIAPLFNGSTVLLRMAVAKELGLTDVRLTATWNKTIVFAAEATSRNKPQKNVLKMLSRGLGLLASHSGTRDLMKSVTVEERGDTLRLSGTIGARWVDRALLAGEFVLLLFETGLVK